MPEHDRTANLTPGEGTQEERDRMARREALKRALAEASEVLPTQSPIRIFVHHNTLHAYEHLPFEEAVEQAARRFGAEPYLSEPEFARHLASGRITPADLEAVLSDEDGEASDEALFDGGPTRRTFRLARLRQWFEVPTGTGLQWHLSESDALRRCHPEVGEAARRKIRDHGRSLLGAPSAVAARAEEAALAALWDRLVAASPTPGDRQGGGLRSRDKLRCTVGTDTDDWVNPMLIRLCAAFVDQGIAYWQLPDRNLGLYRVFRDLYLRPVAPPDAWLRALPAELARQRDNGWDSADTVLALLAESGCGESQWRTFLEETLLSLPGWAGMIHQLELRPDRAPVAAPPARLMDFLAVRLTLDAVAADYARSGGSVHTPAPETTAPDPLSIVYEAFVSAQLLGLGATDFPNRRTVEQWLAANAEFDSFRRRRVLHLAYERRHRVGVLDGLLNHARLGKVRKPRPQVQAVFCLDEREESLRRHIEEQMPDIETFGYAGFFGVPMAYQGLDDLKPTPLCPVVVTPRHLVSERSDDLTGAERSRYRLLGHIRHWGHIGTRTAVRGGVMSSFLGFATVIPLIARCLFPRAAAHLSHHAHRSLVEHPDTRLSLRRPKNAVVGEDELIPGFTTDEMVDIVAGALRTMGARDELADLFLVFGHGSSSLNNPHEAAHDCGACGGGRGGPNARAFAMMANDPEVRAGVRERYGLTIPETTWFVGGYHNTCDEAITYYDLDLVPERLRAELAAVKDVIDQARRLDAHERCRRFEDVPLSVSTESALAYAEAHAVDLGQPRPEYGHATNAVCVIGRRERTRGLFLDRRAFLVSYDPADDAEGDILGPLLQSVGPVGAGINLEYYFSFVDNTRYGCGTKLPHNIVGLVGVMDGHASDLRTGLPWQMVEIHEPVRLLTVIEAEPSLLVDLLDSRPALRQLIVNGWIQVVAWSPSSGAMHVFHRGRFVPYQPESGELASVARSVDHYRGHREHLGCARITSALGREVA